MATILLIERNDDSRQILNYFLSNQGYRVVVAPSLVSLTRLLQAHRPDLIVIGDLDMKEVDVKKSIRTLISRQWRVLIAAQTSYGLKRGINIIKRPFDIWTFLDRVTSILTQ